MKKTMQPTTEVKFKRGPALRPSGELTTYLESLKTIGGKPLLVRLPVVITLDPTGFGIDKATVGELAIKLNDSALGISLMDRLRTACPNASTCAIWLEGHWRSPAGFDIRKVGKPIADAELAQTNYCEVQDL